MFDTYRHVLPQTAALDDGRLTIGGLAVDDLAATHGTPLMVFDEQHMRDALTAYSSAFEGYPGGCSVVYASKAFCCVAMMQLVAGLKLGADVASFGELEIALAGGIPPEKLVLHGNNKSAAELERAVDAGAGLIVVDAAHELEILAGIVADAGATQKILVRVTPGIEAETHHYIKTGHTGSKFGVEPDEAERLLVLAKTMPGIEPVGVHVHLGSQMLDLGTWRIMIDWLAMFVRHMQERGVDLGTIDLGGGLGIAYTKQHRPPTIDEFGAEVRTRVIDAFTGLGLELPHLILEPGRSVVGPAAVTVYTVGVVKKAGSLTYVNVDGGMSDNLRPMLYNAEYSCVLPGRVNDAPTSTYWVAGKHCESGDILIEDAPLPDPRPGDTLAILATGAYTYSLASNYNALLRPPVVFVRDGEARVVVRREELSDLLARDVVPVEAR